MPKPGEAALASFLTNAFQSIGRARYKHYINEDIKKTNRENQVWQERVGFAKEMMLNAPSEFEKSYYANQYTELTGTPTLTPKYTAAIDQPEKKKPDLGPGAYLQGRPNNAYGEVDVYNRINEASIKDPSLLEKQKSQKALTEQRSRVDPKDNGNGKGASNRLKELNVIIDNLRSQIGQITTQEGKGDYANSSQKAVLEQRLNSYQKEYQELYNNEYKKGSKITQGNKKQQADEYFKQLQRGGTDPKTARNMVKQKFGI